MRTVRTPLPRGVWGIQVEGPVDPGAPDGDSARAQLATALEAILGLDEALGASAWTVVWQSAAFEGGPLIRAWVWWARADSAALLLAPIRDRLRAAHFLVRPYFKPGDAPPGLRPRVVYFRSGSVSIGLDPRAFFSIDDVEVVQEDRADVDLGVRFRFASQRCPKCGVVDHPAELIEGFPDRDLSLAAHFGEVVLGGCVDRRSRRNARCRHCGQHFRIAQPVGR